MEQVTYSKVNLRINHGHPSTRTRTTQEGAPPVVYADIRTAGPQYHVPVDDPVTGDQQKTSTSCRYKTLLVVLLLVIVVLCCALFYMGYVHGPDKNFWCEKINDFCLTSSTNPAGCRLCPSDWISHKDDCHYFSHETRKTWEQSRDHCRTMGGDLLVIKDQEQQDFINRNLQQPGYWIGLQIDGEKQNWVDGTHYNISLVQVTTQSPGRCVVLGKTGYYKDKCDDSYGWICLKKALQIDPS